MDVAEKFYASNPSFQDSLKSMGAKSANIQSKFFNNPKYSETLKKAGEIV